jgi:hypothetical protein
MTPDDDRSQDRPKFAPKGGADSNGQLQWSEQARQDLQQASTAQYARPGYVWDGYRWVPQPQTDPMIGKPAGNYWNGQDWAWWDGSAWAPSGWTGAQPLASIRSEYAAAQPPPQSGRSVLMIGLLIIGIGAALLALFLPVSVLSGMSTVWAAMAVAIGAAIFPWFVRSRRWVRVVLIIAAGAAIAAALYDKHQIDQRVHDLQNFGS